MKKQNGATLAITLIILFIITLLGVSTMQVMSLQEKMSSNLQDKELSFRAAESAVKDAEDWLMSLVGQPPIEQGVCASFPCVHEVYQNIDFATAAASFWQSNAASLGANLQNVATPPRYIIEYLQFVPDTPEIGNSSVKSTGVFYYQITARGTGAQDSTVTIIQTTLGRRY